MSIEEAQLRTRNRFLEDDVARLTEELATLRARRAWHPIAEPPAESGVFLVGVLKYYGLWAYDVISRDTDELHTGWFGWTHWQLIEPPAVKGETP